MEVVKMFAKQRGVKAFSFSGMTMPVELALEDDQLAPLIIASAAFTYAQSGLYDEEAPFPWSLDVDETNDSSLFDGAYVHQQDSCIPLSVGYLFLDYEIENLVLTARMNQEMTDGVVSLDGLAEKLEVVEHEPHWAKRTPFNPAF